MLKLSIENAQQFLDLFYKPEIDGHELTKRTKVSLFILRVEGGRFAYEDIKKVLGNASITYVLSRNKVAEIGRGNAHEIIKKVQESFRKPEENSGEAGELFLYCFLETHLGAPKILSKMELKTAKNDYIKGSDGIHLLSLGNGTYHLIFGESKMISDSTVKGSSLSKSITSAFQSIKKVESEGICNEISLIDSNIMKETYDEDTIKFLKSIIIPSANDKSVVKYNAFGIFVGFEIDIADWDLQQMDDTQFESKLKEKIRTAVESKYEYIKQQIDKENLSGYHFYIYAVPFIKNKEINIDDTRKKIIKYIT